MSETERRKKKEPLFMRLEAEGRARSLAIEKEKVIYCCYDCMERAMLTNNLVLFSPDYVFVTSIAAR